MSGTPSSPAPRGWCPGALRPMESGDGLIVRLRPRGGAFTTPALRVIADLAARYGNGQIDLTRRANLQLRGLRDADLPALWEALSATGLLDESAEAESVRNVMVSPLAGLAPDEIADPRPVARALENRLTSDERLWSLPGKFGFSVDGGGAFSIANERADIRLQVVTKKGETTMALGLDRLEGVDWVASTTVDQAATMASAAAHLFLEMRRTAPQSGEARRLRDLAEADYLILRTRVASVLPTLACPPLTTSPDRSLGILERNGAAFALAMAVPFGRIEAGQLHRLATEETRLGIPQVRLSPWRTLYAPLIDHGAGDALAAMAAEAGFILDAADPLLAIDACPGAPGCGRTHLDTRQAARDLAPHLKRLGVFSCHISGCAKGCARSRAADLVLVGSGDGYGLNRDATAQESPRAVVPRTQLSRLRHLVETL
ncbi:precorrin-3B synthase [Methyloligella solikamskensis]|uniref:Precorrin-3B synthase n=1 Tax=Methyloligella solikamskensis TaxID=1177756 RepID=A0ABW3JA54_9HYPH